MRAAGDQSGEMRHVDQQQGAGLVGNLTHPGKVEDARISAASANDQLWPLSLGDPLQFVVVNHLGLALHSIRDDAVEFAGKVQLVAVGQVTAVGEVKAEDGVSG